MAELAVLLLSDLHAGPGNLWPELRTRQPGKGKKKTASIGPSAAHYSLDALVRSAKEILDQTPPDRRVLLCTGDLSSACHSEELAATAQFLTAVADRLQIPLVARLVLPGNHDIDWTLTKLAAKVDAWYDGYRQRKLTDALSAHAKDFQCPTDGVALHALRQGSLQIGWQ